MPEPGTAERGQRADEFFILLSGSAYIAESESGYAVELERPGTFFGEAVFNHVNSVRSATVETRGRTRLAVLSLADWNDFKDKHLHDDHTAPLSTSRVARGRSGRPGRAGHSQQHSLMLIHSNGATSLMEEMLLHRRLGTVERHISGISQCRP